MIGSLKDPRIFGAGLLSSVGEAKLCLSSEVKRIPLSVDCVDFSYDITEPQPQLFVAKDFAQLGDVLEELSAKLAYRHGGEFGLRKAVEAETVNTVVLDSNIQIAGRLRNFLTDDNNRPCYLQFEGPSQLAYADREIPGQGTARHSHGYSCPVGLLQGHSRPLHTFAATELTGLGFKKGSMSELVFASGVRVAGQLENVVYHDGQLILMTFTNCRVNLGGQILFEPSWGEYDMAVGSAIPSVCGGPADREKFGTAPDFVAQRVPDKSYSPSQLERHSLYAQIRDLRERPRVIDREKEIFQDLTERYLKTPTVEWLPGIELLEISYQFNLAGPARSALERRLDPANYQSDAVRMAVRDGLAMAQTQL